jgi:hypothetical protein
MLQIKHLFHLILKRFVTLTDQIHQYYFWHPLCEVYMTCTMFQTSLYSCLQMTGFQYTERFNTKLKIVFKSVNSAVTLYNFLLTKIWSNGQDSWKVPWDTGQKMKNVQRYQLNYLEIYLQKQEHKASMSISY